jgi:hypothetical protein
VIPFESSLISSEGHTDENATPLSISAPAVISLGRVGAQDGSNIQPPLKNWPAPLYWQPTAAEAGIGNTKPGAIRDAGAPDVVERLLANHP